MKDPMVERHERMMICPHCEGTGYLERRCETCAHRGLAASGDDYRCHKWEGPKYLAVVADDDWCEKWQEAT